MYIINFTDTEKEPIIIYAEQIDTTTVDVTLIGKSTMEYGEQFDENVLHLLENFACVEDSTNPGNPDLTQSLLTLLDNPIEGQCWFNKSDKLLYYWNATKWSPVGQRANVAANSGIIVHGEQLPRPTAEDGYVFSYNECSWFVSPQYLDRNVNYVECYTDINARVYVRFRPTGNFNDQLTPGLANYMIIGIRDSRNHGIPYPLPSVPAPPPVTPTPTISRTVTATNTPTAFAPTVTPTNTRTPTFTPTSTPTITPTAPITPTMTPTPTVTPSTSPQVFSTFILTAGYGSVYGPSVDYSIGFNAFAAGFNPVIGAISPNTYDGNQIRSLFTQFLSGLRFTVIMTGAVPQMAFSTIRFIDNTNTEQIFDAGLATYNINPSGNAQWTWNVTTDMFSVGTSYLIRIYA